MVAAKNGVPSIPVFLCACECMHMYVPVHVLALSLPPLKTFSLFVGHGTIQKSFSKRPLGSIITVFEWL